MKSNSHGVIHLFIPFLIVVFLIVVGLFAYLRMNKQTAQTNTAEIASWETYTNDQFAVSFKYPSEKLSIQEITDPHDLSRLASVSVHTEYEMIGDPGIPNPSAWLGNISITELGFRGDINKEEEVEELNKLEVSETYKIKGPDFGYYTIVRLPDQAIGDLTAKVFERDRAYEGKGPWRIVLVNNGERQFYIWVTYNNPDDSSIDFINIVDQILSTFKFTE